MSRGLPTLVKENIDKCKSATIAAVDVYNRPGPRFRTAHYIILIIMAWTALFHAIFYKRRKKPCYQGRTGRYIRIDGDLKHWELSECLKQFYGSTTPPERKNLEFLIGLRNKIEHRSIPELDAGLYGECQAALLNLEELLCANFGQIHAMAEQLAISLQFTSLTPEKKKEAARELAKKATRSIKDYVETFRSGLPSSTLNSTKYSFNVFLVPKVVNRIGLADSVIEFVKIDEASTEELGRLEKLNILIKEKHVPISNLGLHKPREIVRRVQADIPYRFSVNNHAAAWRHYKVRPAPNAAKPEVTSSTYCIYDSVHNDYLYTDAWTEMLIRDLSSAAGFKTATGMNGQSK